ncbi:MAG TPA: Nif3-like dinuclear metal center hexameric protein [Deltaproteobacteria bacterium]|nr:Nif3-like dinuclear metal center hexameric protein [Deltaproteobacteria bacterium]HDH98232.1 Nif3-like dinuclear metal center hexameric protein [Deltaproteobacteria bacterium]
MTPTVCEIWNVLSKWAPPGLAESWDNIGLQVGDPNAPVQRLMVALDATENVLEAASEQKVRMVLTHHPLLFRPVSSLDISKQLPRLLAGFLRKNIALAAAHTNLDSTVGGVSDLLANALGLSDVKPLHTSEPNPPSVGLGRIGNLPYGCKLSEIMHKVSSMLGNPGLLVVGHPGQMITRVALCGGSGSDLWPMAIDEDADLFLSAEIKHHIAREAEQMGKAIIDAGHFYTEWPVVPAMAEYMKQQASEEGWDLEVYIFDDEKSPFGLWINENVKTGEFVPGARPLLSINTSFF